MIEQDMTLGHGIAVTAVVGLCFAFYFAMMLRFFDRIAAHPIKKRYRIVAGFITYGFFIAATLLQFPLYINWTLVAVLYVGEILLLYRIPPRLAVCLGIQGALLSLAINSITRTLLALLVEQPLAAFDSKFNIYVNNIKRFPIAAAFLLTGALFWLMCKALINVRWTTDLFDDVRQRLFLVMSISLFAYLDLNLFIYATGGVEAIIKLWCLKSALCVLFGDLLYLLHIQTIARHLNYAQENSRARRELETGHRSNAALEDAANRDVLTGCQSRVVALHTLETLFSQPGDFLLCFLDLNGLKQVNDQLGHNSGDQYLAAVGHALCATMKTDAVVCRYGGDEFIVLQLGGDAAALRGNMEEVRRVLAAHFHTSQYPFALSVSYGIAARREADSVDALLALADARMYADKKNQPAKTV